MEYINNLGAIGKLSYRSNVSSLRHIGYYFDEQLIDTNLFENTHLMVNVNDVIPDNITCLMINVKISFENLYRIICDTSIQTIIFFKEMLVDNINAIVVCKNILTIVCYNTISVSLIEKFFPNVRNVYLYRQREMAFNGKLVAAAAPPSSPEGPKHLYNFPNLQKFVIYSSGTSFVINAPNLEEFCIYLSLGMSTLDMNNYPKLHTVRVDEKIILSNLTQRKSLKILQYYPSKNRSSLPTTILDDVLDFSDMRINDLILPPTQKYIFKKRNVVHTLGVYVSDGEFLNNTLTKDLVGFQVYDNLYPLKTCNIRFNNLFYKYFPFPSDITNELIERFNIQKQRENLIMIFNFDFMNNIQDAKDWFSWYNTCTEIYHRLPIIIQNGQLMLKDGSSGDGNEKQWPLLVNKTRRECVVFLPEEELIYINCSPMRLQTLVDKIKSYRNNKFIISKLWLVTNGFELKTKDIEDRLENLVIVHNEIKMYITV